MGKSNKSVQKLKKLLKRPIKFTYFRPIKDKKAIFVLKERQFFIRLNSKLMNLAQKLIIQQKKKFFNSNMLEQKFLLITLQLYNEKRSIYYDGTAHVELSKTNRFPSLNATVNGQFYWYGTVLASRIVTKNGKNLLTVR